YSISPCHVDRPPCYLLNYNTKVSYDIYPNRGGYSNYQTKAKGGAYATLISRSVGGSYTVDARETGHSGPASWRRDVTDSKTYSLPSIQSAGYDAIVQFSNDLNTPVNVRVTGSWASN
ncbi:hypothetical protein, partial [Rossellomorea aquimaris]